MSSLFEGDSDSDADIKTNNEYAIKYDIWRKKEELNKLKTKYGEDINISEDSSSSSDDDDGIELTERIEKDFLKTLACLKNKDPRIYDANVKFFDSSERIQINLKKERKEKSVYIKDYERNLILEKGGTFSDEEDHVDEAPKSPTYVEEQNAIKESLKEALNVVNDEENENEWGGLFRERRKTKEDKEKEEADYKIWLLGQKNEIDDKEVQSELKPLKDYWNNPNLDEGEKFLRDYILNKRFLDTEDQDYIPTYDQIIHDSDGDLSNDEETVEKQEDFEHKYNFRFEEPDQEFVKRYPRTMENSVRRKDDRRKLKRQETKERKKKEKEEKLKELKKLQELKRQEIEDKLDKLKEITGNNDIGFADEDIDGDFDPEVHDKRMQTLFNDEFYQEQESNQKPEFPDLDEELEIENWERYENEVSDNNSEYQPHCEDEGFNMDCDYDPNMVVKKNVIETMKDKKKRKRKSKFAEAVSKSKPKYDPNDRNYEEYFEEYYKLDCEDIIGDVPCRFKYRKVLPNDFGLTTEEILMAKERELNRWCSLKKTLQIRPDHVEKYDQIAYKKKAQNINLKKKILPSLFTENIEENEETFNNIKDKTITEKNNIKNVGKINEKCEEKVFNKANLKNTKEISEDRQQIDVEDLYSQKLVSFDVSDTLEQKNNNSALNLAHNKSKKKKVKKTKATNNSNVSVKKKRKHSEGNIDKGELPKKKPKKEYIKEKKANISDARLTAYGINPKKFKNKLKYPHKR